MLWFSSLYAQSIKGVVLDASTNQPIESASVYFDNTSIGTSTNDKGEFEIALKEDVSSALVISFLGYETALLRTYSPDKFYKVLLNEAINTLDEVVISTDDGMPREMKLEHFRAQFIGLSKIAKSCRILNEEVLNLSYNKKKKTLTASAYEPIRIQNEDLEYLISFDIKTFVINYAYINIDRDKHVVRGVSYTGTSYYKSLAVDDAAVQVKKKRDEAYNGSVLHFMRALRNKRLKEEKFTIYSEGFRVDPSRYISISELEDTKWFQVKLRAPLSVRYQRKYQSEIKLPFKLSKSDSKAYYNIEIKVDTYGNYSPIGAFYFIGHMGDQRIGDSLPYDYEPSKR